MKKRIISTCILLSCFLLTSCAGEDNSEPAETTAPIYVENEGLLYAENGVLESASIEAAESEESEAPANNSSETPENSKPSVPTGGDGGNSPSTTNPGSNTPAPDDKDDEPKDSIYNTTIEPNLDKSDISFGMVNYVYYDNIIVSEDENRPGETSIKKSGTSTYLVLGDLSYGMMKADILVHNGATYIEDPFIIQANEDDANNNEFEFTGTGHYFKKSNGEYGTNFYLELEQNNEIVPAKKVKNIKVADAYNVAIKGIAVKLGEFDKVTSRGYADNNTQPYIIKFIANTPSGEQEIEVGMPYQQLVNLLGEGTEIKVNVASDDESTEAEEVSLYVYKTDDYTMLVEKTEYPDIKPDEIYVEEDGVSENTVLISTIILIKNEAEVPTLATEES